MVSIAEGLRMMQGGVDRTGFADMAESLGNPGLDLIAARRAAASEAEALKEYERKKAESDEEFRSEIDRLLEGIQQSGDDPIDGPKQKIDLVPGGAFDKALTGGLTGSFFGLPGAAIGTGVGLASQGYEDMMSRIVGEFDEGGSFEGGLSYGDDADYLENLNKVFEMGAMQGGLPMAVGGRVHLQGGGMDAGASSASGDKGFGAGVSGGVQSAMGGKGNQGGKQDSSKSVDIDQLEKKEEPVVTVQPAVKPTLDDLLNPQISPYAPVEEASMIDTLSKYNPLAQTFAINPNLSFNYDIDPNLKDLSDLNAQANLTYSFNRGGPVSETMQDAIDDMKAEELARKAEEFRSRMEQPLDKPSLDQYTEDSMLMLSERPDSVFLDPPVGIGGNTIQEAPPIGISGTITDDELTAGYGMPVGTGGISGQLTMPFENDPMLQLMLEQQLADDLSLNADVSLMEDMDPFFSLKMTKDF